MGLELSWVRVGGVIRVVEFFRDIYEFRGFILGLFGVKE